MILVTGSGHTDRSAFRDQLAGYTNGCLFISQQVIQISNDISYRSGSYRQMCLWGSIGRCAFGDQLTDVPLADVPLGTNWQMYLWGPMTDVRMVSNWQMCLWGPIGRCVFGNQLADVPLGTN